MKTLLVWLGGLALIVVLFWYLRGAFRRRPQYRLKNLPSPAAGSFVAALAALSDSFLGTGQVTDFWVEAEAIFAARLGAIRSAQRSIEFETYIMTPGQRSDDLAIALCERAEAGVKIHLIADSYGAKSLSPAYWQRLEAFGIEVGFYNPASWRHPLGACGAIIANY
ncbi:MAG: hypothetical protein HC890_12670 [Chloroflexaceae bacterium]|nr:hypothetical protein [Chloroflexaceae bacterium]